jgi:protein-S-isoprenylcysteine O-methyltransferase Ste14
MYIERFFLLLGGMVLMGSVWIILAFLLFYYFYLINRVKREETKLNRIFREEFKSYEVVSKRFSLVKVKAGDHFNRRNTLSISRIEM